MTGPMGGGPLDYENLAQFTISTDVVPVRIIQGSAPLKVLVMNFPGVPPPLPDMLQGPTWMPKLPTPPKDPAQPSGSGFGDILGKMGFGNLLKFGSAIGIATAGLAELKSVAIDPLIGAAKSGFDQGVAKGMGSETLGRSFQYLGVVIGVELLPAILNLSAAIIALADEERKKTPEDKIGRNIDLITPGVGAAFKKAGWLKPELINQRGGEGIDALGKVFPGVGGAINAVMKGAGGGDFAKKQASALEDLVKSMRQSIVGSQAQTFGLADIRGAAQNAALNQDPLELRLKQALLDAVDRTIPEMAQNLARAANNVDPKR